MLVCVVLFELYIPHAQSLKDKRMVVRSLRDRLRSRFEVSAHEVAMHDLHQRARFGVAFVAIDDAAADATLEHIHHFVETNADATLNGWTVEKLEFDELAAL
jgi:uncharacterized protein YlxP (DUF503 family)